MRYKLSDADLLEQAAQNILAQEKQIEELRLQLFQIKQRVCTFIFGEPERHDSMVFNRESYPSFTDKLKERAVELRSVKDE